MYPLTPYERALEIFDHLNSALEPVDTKCVDKIICEVGELAGEVGLTTNPILRYALFLECKHSWHLRILGAY